jgi:hypothetical protein
MRWSLEHGQVGVLASKEPPLASHCSSLATSSPETPPSPWAPVNLQPPCRTGSPPLKCSTQVTTSPSRQPAMTSPRTPQAPTTGASQSHGAARSSRSPTKRRGSSPPCPRSQPRARSRAAPSSHTRTLPCPHPRSPLAAIMALRTAGGLAHTHATPPELPTLAADQFARGIFHMPHAPTPPTPAPTSTYTHTHTHTHMRTDTHVRGAPLRPHVLFTLASEVLAGAARLSSGCQATRASCRSRCCTCTSCIRRGHIARHSPARGARWRRGHGHSAGRVPELSRACGAGALAVAEGESDLAIPPWGAGDYGSRVE